MKKSIIVAAFTSLLINTPVLCQIHPIPTLVNPAPVTTISFTFSPTPSSTITTSTTPVTAAQWHFAGTRTVSGSADWTYAIITTTKKEYIGVGYSDHGGRHPAIYKLDHYGNLVWSKEINGTDVTVVDFTGSKTTPTTTTEPTSGYYDHGGDYLLSVTEASDGKYVAVGAGHNSMLIVEFDEAGTFFNNTPMDVILYNWPDAYDARFNSLFSPSTPLTYPVGTAYAVAVDPNVADHENHIVVGGHAEDNSSSGVFNGAGIITMDYASGSWSINKEYFGGHGYGSLPLHSGSCITKILVKSTSGTTYDIYACGMVSAQDDNQLTPSAWNADPHSSSPISFFAFDKDMWVLKASNTMGGIIATDDRYNKSNIKVDVGGGVLSAINAVGAYTNTAIYRYQEVGPVTARNEDGLTGDIVWTDRSSGYLGTPYLSSATLYLNAEHNKCEAAYDMVFTNDGSNDLAVIGLVNHIGTNAKSSNSETDANVVLSYYPPGTTTHGTICAAPDYAEYRDGDAFLLKIDPSLIGTHTTGGDPTSLAGAKNVGHFSGNDFFMQVKQDIERNFIISGSSADYYGTVTTSGGSPTYSTNPDINLIDPTGSGDQNAYLVGTDNDFSYSHHADLWRRTFFANDLHARVSSDGNAEDCMCVFGLDVTADGGYVIAGNNGNNGDDWSVTKFAPLHEELMIKNSGYEEFGSWYVPTEYGIYGTETWSSSKYIASKVIVESGGVLNITGSGTHIRFAASDQLYDYFAAPDYGAGGTVGCGIYVKPGGTLNVTDATLEGISITGEHNVWDGIVVEGTYTATPSPANQGNVNLTRANINDARYGLFVADNYRAYTPQAPIYGSLVNGYNYGSRYDGTCWNGGGIVAASSSNFLNCAYGAAFENYILHVNPSYFTGCNFNSDNTGLGDICFYTDGNGALLPANAHICALQWRLLKVNNCTFDCSTSFSPGERPTGIFSGNSLMNIGNSGGNTFRNLSFGVHTSHTGLAYPTIIQNNTFSNNDYGVFAGSIIGLQAENNNFYVPGVPYVTWFGSSYYAHNTGMNLAGCSGYAVYNNNFDNCTGCQPFWKTGIVVNNGLGHNQEEKVNLNTFGSLTWATQAAGNNGNTSYSTPSGLQFLCNQYNSSAIDIDRGSFLDQDPTGPHPATMRPIQGACVSPSSPAGNQFNFACVTGLTHPGSRLAIEDNMVAQNVTYNFNSAIAAMDPTSACANTLYTRNPCTGLSSLISDACPEPCSGCGLPDYYANLSTLDAAIAAATDPDVLVDLNTQHTWLLHDMAAVYADSNNYDSAAWLYSSYNMYKEALPYYLTGGDYTDAQTMHDDMILSNADDTLYSWIMQLGINLYSAGHTWFDIDTTNLDSLKKIVQYNKEAGYIAGGITTLLGVKPVTIPVVVIDSSSLDTLIADSTQGGGGEGGRLTHTKSPVTELNSSVDASFKIHPNPTIGNFTVVASGSGKLILYTLLGQELTAYAITAGSTDFQLPANMAAGMYLGVFRPECGGKTSKVRIIYQP